MKIFITNVWVLAFKYKFEMRKRVPDLFSKWIQDKQTNKKYLDILLSAETYLRFYHLSLIELLFENS